MVMPSQEQAIYPEIWIRLYLYIYGLQQHYIISNYGRIFNEKTATFLPKNQSIDYDYTTIRLTFIDGHAECFLLHRLIAYVFVPNSTGDYTLEVNHKDGIKGHSWAWNLEWIDTRGNMIHTINHNLVALGESRSNSKLTNSQVIRICELIESGKTNAEIINAIGTDLRKGDLQNIRNGHCWSHISKNYDFSNAATKSKFTAEQIHTICKYFQNHGTKKSYREVLVHLGIDVTKLSSNEMDNYNAAIGLIRDKKSYKNICNLYDYDNAIN